MGIRSFFSKTTAWLKSPGIANSPPADPLIDDQGLMAEASDDTARPGDAESAAAASHQDAPVATAEPQPQRTDAGRRRSRNRFESAGAPAVAETQPKKPGMTNKVLVQAVAPDKRESIEKLQEGFAQLVDQLNAINGNLKRQVEQHQQLMERVDRIPGLLETFPDLVQNQARLTDSLLASMETSAAKNDRFIDAVEQIPAQTARQTDALTNIDHHLAASAQTDVQMTEAFNTFNNTLAGLNNSTQANAESIEQMSRTFAASDRYLKYILMRQNRRFFWGLIITAATCAIAIAAL
ncbi:MAG TPA: hypothetical protein ENN81_08435, partial [Phycisphaerales bacterium]|nr:hypothetical protein [Phycisphaerales bacterium]